MNKEKLGQFIRSFLLWFIIFYLALLITESLFGKKKTDTENQEIAIVPVSEELVLGNLAEFKIQNHLHTPISLPSPCETNSLKVVRLVNNQEIPVSSFSDCNGKNIPSLEIAPKTETYFAIKDFNSDIYTEAGRYKMSMTFQAGEESKEVKSTTYTYEEPGLFRQLFRALISKPLFNLLVYLTNVLPTHSFGWAIVLLTILVRCLLFMPNQKAIKSQHELQRLQPKLEELRKKHGKNQQMLAIKTMELYKTHKINPMSSCLPILLQMPFLIGIYFVVRDGLSPHLNHLLYSFNTQVDLSIVDSQFFTLDLGQLPPWWTLPIAVAVIQYFAMKLTFQTTEKRKGNTPAPAKDSMAGQMAQVQKTMLYVMPVMIGFFTATFPAAVGVYWLTSTLFGIIQQKVLYWQLDRPSVIRKKE